MHRSSVLAIALTTTVVAVAATAPRRDRAPGSTPIERHRAAEVARLRAHFDSVDAELRASDVSGLTGAQRNARARLIAWLREYRDAGRFPENDRFATPEPFFRDHRGVLCAMAYLIDRSGRGDIVDDVARTRNNAYIRELTDDPRLVAWLDSAGLTAAEAARIQPQYGPPPTNNGGSTEKKVSRSYAVSSGVLIGASLGSAAINIAAPGRKIGVFGTVVGVGAGLVGLDGMARGGEYRTLGAVTTASGAVALVAGIRAIRHVSQRGEERSAARVTVVPALLGTTRRSNLGFLLRARF